MALAVLLLLPVSLRAGACGGLQHNPTTYGDAVVRLVQPNISQDDKWRADNATDIFSTLMNLSAQGAGQAGVKLIVWPESSVPFLLDEDKVALSRIAGVLSPGRMLLAGAIRRDRAANSNEAYYTSVVCSE